MSLIGNRQSAIGNNDSLSSDSPWPGLASFTEEARSCFFGREKETEELVRLLEAIRRIGARLIALTGNPQSTLGQASDVTLNCHVAEEAFTTLRRMAEPARRPAAGGAAGPGHARRLRRGAVPVRGSRVVRRARRAARGVMAGGAAAGNDAGRRVAQAGPGGLTRGDQPVAPRRRLASYTRPPNAITLRDA